MKQSILIIILSLLVLPKTILSQNLKARLLSRNETINIDGRLNEKCWNKSIVCNKLYSKESIEKVDSKTKVFFLNDDKNIYVAFEIEKKNIKRIKTKIFSKDDERILSNEWVTVSLDPYNDGVTAYTFFVDIYGNQFDGTLNSSKDLSNSFSMQWKSAVNYNESGYSIELKIPLISLPVQKNKTAEMGVLFVHNKKDSGEFQFPFIPHDSKNKIDQFQKIILEKINLTQPRYLSGVNIIDRLAYKKLKIKDLASLRGRAQGGDASVMDYYIFKKRNVQADKSKQIALNYSSRPQSEISKSFMKTMFMKEYYPNSSDFETFLERSQTTAFIVIQNDTVLYEKYFNGFKRDSVFTSFSMAKSIVSILTGIAIEKKYITSENDLITDYIPDLIEKDIRFSAITIKDLLTMSSGIDYSEDGFPSDDDFTYISPDLRKAALDNVKIKEEPNKHWVYNNYNPILLGIILERATKMSISEFTEQNLWNKIASGNASWSLDEVGFEKMESGFNCLPIDYARIGFLMMNKGKVNGENILATEWVQKSTQPINKPSDYYDFLEKKNSYYQYFWWGKKRQADLNDFFALGNKGEYMYIIPSKKITIIRLGFEYGMFTPGSFSWPELFYEFGTIL